MILGGGLVLKSWGQKVAHFYNLPDFGFHDLVSRKDEKGMGCHKGLRGNQHLWVEVRVEVMI